MMKFCSVVCASCILFCALAINSSLAQNLPSIPPSLDPGFWGRINKPYSLKLTQTTTGVSTSNAPHIHLTEANISRDSAGRERTEAFYDTGSLKTVSIRDPGKSTLTMMKAADKSAIVFSIPRPVTPPPGKGWTVESLPPRVIAGFPVEGLRFTRAVVLPDDVSREPVTVVEEDWISNQLNVVLEQTVNNPRIGKTTKTVIHLVQAEPDPALFVVPNDYSVHQVGSPTH